MTAWPRVQLRRLARLGTGHTPSRQHPEYWEDCTIPWLTLADVWQLRDGTRRVVIETAEQISELGLANSAAELHSAGTVALSRTASVGFSCILGQDMATSQDFATWTCGPRLLPRFLLWALRGTVEDIVAATTGSTHKTIYMPDIQEIAVPLPPIETQSAVAAFLDAETARIDALIDKKRRLIQLGEERFDSEVYRAVTRGLDPDVELLPVRIEWICEMPAHWGLPSVSAHYDVQLGKMLNPEAASGPSLHPYLRNVNIQWDRIDLSELPEMHFDDKDRRRLELRTGDLLVCEGGEVGRAAIWEEQIPNCYFQKAIHRVRPRRHGNTRFLMYCLRAAARRRVFEVEGNQSTIVHLTAEKLSVHRFPWPPLEEQRAIVGHLDHAGRERSELVGRIARQVMLLNEHRQALITAAVTGQLDVSKAAA